MLRGAHRQLRLRQQEPAVHDGEYAGDVQRGRGHDPPKQAKMLAVKTYLQWMWLFVRPCGCYLPPRP